MSHSVSVGATAPEALSFLHQRLLVAEEQAEDLVRDMGSLGVPRDHFPLPIESKSSDRQPVRPLMMHRSSRGDSGGALGALCDPLVSRVCHLESLLQTLKLTIFRLETERELDPSHPARLKEQLATLQQENTKEQRVSRRELMKLQDQVRQASEERDEARLEVQKLSEALEVATATKMDTALAAEELKIINEQMSEKLSEMEQQMIQDYALSFESMKSHSELLQQLEDMERVMEMERRQAQLVQADCQALRSEGQVSRQSLREEQDKARRLQEHCQWLQEQTEGKGLLVSELKKQQKENSKLLKDGAELRAAADKVQALNNQLERQCSELSSALYSHTVENAKQQTEHQASLKAERNRVIRRLQEHDLLLEATRRNVQAELQGSLSEKASLQMELEKLKADRTQLLQCSAVAQETAATQRELLERTISRLRGELSTAQKEQGVLRKDLDDSQNELRVVVTKLEGEKSALERRLSEAKREAGCLSSALQRQEEESRRLMGKMAAMEQQQVGKAEALQDVSGPTGGAVGQTLDNVLASRSLQQDLGGREQELDTLRRDRQQAHRGIHRHQSEVDKLQDLLSSAHCNNNRALESLSKALDTARLDNRKLAQSLEQSVRTNASLQNKLEQTGHHTHRGEELHEARTKISHLSEQLDTLQCQMTKDKEASRRTLHREISELKRSLEDSSNRTGDTSKSNRGLQRRVSELEKLVSSQKARIRLQKTQLRQHLENRGTLDVSQNIKKPEESYRKLRRDEDEAIRKLHDARMESQQKPEESYRKLRRDEDEAIRKLHDARMESQQRPVDLNETLSCVQSEGEGSQTCWNQRSGQQDPTPTYCKDDSQAPGEGEPEWRRWTSIIQRWEAKRELARIAGRYRPGRTQLLTQSP